MITDFKSQASWLDQARKTNDKGEQSVSDNQIINALIQQRPELSQPYSRLKKSTKDHPLAATKFLNHTFYGDANYAKPVQPPKPLSLEGLVDTSYMEQSDPSRYSTQDLQSAIGKPESFGGAIVSGVKGGVVGTGQTVYNIVKSGVDLVNHLPSALVSAAAIPAGAVEEFVARYTDPTKMFPQEMIDSLPPDKRAEFDKMAERFKAPDSWERHQFMGLMKSTGLADLFHGAKTADPDQMLTGADTAINFAYQHPAETVMAAEGGVRGVNKALGKNITTPLEAGQAITNKMTSVPGSMFKGAKKALGATKGATPEVPTDEGFQRAVQPKRTTADTKDLLNTDPKAVQDGMNKAGLMKKSPGPNFTKQDVDLGNTAKTIKGYKPVDPNKPMTMKEAIDNSVAVHEAIKSDSTALRGEMIAKGDGAIPPAETVSKISGSLEGIKKYFKGDEARIESVQTLAKEIAQSKKGTWSGQWDARIEFYKQAEMKWGKNIWDKSNVISQAVNTAGEAWNSVINDAAAKAGVSFTPQMNRLSTMYDIKSNLSTHVTNDIYNSKVTNLLKNSTPARVITKAAASSAGLGMGLEILR